jgi:2-C-methyl-D-erythritol 4-phosphate cytidylyltransferase/2-C-methyl-D-erythritol 2,4-cyclodiphosphate synthase
MDAVAVVLAAGSGERLGADRPKAFLELAGRTILEHSVAAATARPEVTGLVVAVPPGSEQVGSGLLEGVAVPAIVVAGGPTRQASVRSALDRVPDEATAVVCHDAARPLATPGLFGSVIAALDEADGVVPVVPIPDTLKRVRGDLVLRTESRGGMFLAQTPQACRLTAFRDAHARAAEAGYEATDDVGLLEWAGYRVRAVPGEPGNFKVTSPEDLARAATLLARAAGG